MNRRNTVWIMLLACCSLGLPRAQAMESLSLREVINEVIQHRPELEISNIEMALAENATRSLEGLLDPRFQAQAGLSEEQTPVASSFQPTRQRTAQLSASIQKPLSSGDTLGLDARYTRLQQSFNSPFAAQLAAINPAYRSQINLNIRHPLAKGNEFPSYVLGKQAAREQETAAYLQWKVTAYQLMLGAINRFFTLAKDELNIHYALLAVKRAERLLQYQKRRASLGLVEETARLQAEALLSARKTQLQQARLQYEIDRTELNRFMIRPTQATVRIQLPPLPVIQSLDTGKALQMATRQRPDFAVFDARIRAQEARLLMARDQDRMQLDLVAELGTRSLAASAGKAAASTLSINDKYAALSVEWSDALHRHQEKSAIREAELTRQKLQAQKRQLAESVHDDLARLQSTISALREVLRLAHRQLDTERRKFAAEMQLYREGRSDTHNLIQTEHDLYLAEQQWQTQQLSLELACWQWQWATGALVSWLPEFSGHMAPQP